MKNRAIVIIMIVAVAAAILYWPVKKGPSGIQDNRLTITTSFYPVYFLAKEIAGDKANVYNITPAGAEPHDYDLTTKDRMQLENSRILFLNGGNLEPWGRGIEELLPNTKVVRLADPYIYNGDPHVWLDPVLLAKEAGAITETLKQIDPANAKAYEVNYANLVTGINLMDDAFRSGLSKCEKQDIITAHEAFSYLSRRYGFNQISIAGISPDAEPSPRALAEVSDLAHTKDIKYIFFESLVSPKLAEAVARESGAKTLVLNPLEGLSSSDLAGGKNFFTEMSNNLQNLRTALVCQ